MTNQRVLAWIGPLFLAAFPLNALAAKHWSTPKKHTVVLRLLSEDSRPQVSSFGLNAQQFIAETMDGHSPKLLKLVYEYLYYEPPLTGNPLDSTLEYSMRVIRDPSCDASRQGVVPSALSVIELRCYRTSAADIRSQRKPKQVAMRSSPQE